MRRMTEKFNTIQKRNPLFSSYICFAELVRGQKMTQRSLVRHFHNLVEKDDYAKNEEEEIIDHLMSLA